MCIRDRNARDGDTIYCQSDGSQMQRVAVVIREKAHEVFSRSENKRDDVVATIRLTRKECEEGAVKIIKGLNGREIRLKVNKGAVEKGKDKWHTVVGEGFYVSKPRMDVNNGSETANTASGQNRSREDLRVRFRQMSGFEAFLEERLSIVVGETNRWIYCGVRGVRIRERKSD